MEERKTSSDQPHERAVRVRAADRPGVLHGLSGVLGEAGADIRAIEIVTRGQEEADVLLQYTGGTSTRLLEALRGVDGVVDVEEAEPASEIYGKRIIVMGGGAQVGQVAMAAISEADRHNIRGERISIDTIPLVGENELASAVRAAIRLPRVHLLVLAGSLMGGEITKAVREVREAGLPVISLNMAGSVPKAADLVVTDPVQAGVMAVMAVADTASFDLLRQPRRTY